MADVDDKDVETSEVLRRWCISEIDGDYKDGLVIYSGTILIHNGCLKLTLIQGGTRIAGTDLE